MLSMIDFRKAFLRDNFPRIFRGLVLLLAAAALFSNITVCWKVYRNEPLREAYSRSLMAVNSSYFYDSGLVEPVPVAALKAAMAAGADPDKALRLEGLALFFVIALLTYLVLRPRFGEMAASMSVLFLAANPFMGYYAMQGSSHLFALVFLLLFWHFWDAPEPRRSSDILAGLYGGLAILCRLDAFFALLPIAALSRASRPRSSGLKGAGLALGLSLLLVLPYVIYQRAHYGSFFYGQELSLRRWANIDLYGYSPQTPPPAGPLATSAFLFRDGPARAVRSVFAGLGRSLAYELPRTLYYKFLLILVFLGVYAEFVLKKRRLLFFLGAALLPVLPLAAIKQVPSTGGIELRYFLWSLWPLCALAGLGFQETLAWAEVNLDKWVTQKNEAYSRAGKK